MIRFFPWLLLLFPALELWAMIQIGSHIGALATIALLFLSTAAGLALLRLRGAHAARNMQAELAAGRVPANPIADTFFLMIAGWLFIFPGFISDILALLLLLPGIRRLLLGRFSSTMKAQGFQGQTVFFRSWGGGGASSWNSATYDVSGKAKDLGNPEHPVRRGNAVVIDCEPVSSSALADDEPGQTQPGERGANK